MCHLPSLLLSLFSRLSPLFHGLKNWSSEKLWITAGCITCHYETKTWIEDFNLIYSQCSFHYETSSDLLLSRRLESPLPTSNPTAVLLKSHSALQAALDGEEFMSLLLILLQCARFLQNYEVTNQWDENLSQLEFFNWESIFMSS